MRDFTREYKDADENLYREISKGELHSLYSPAIEYSNGSKAWYQNGKLHRLDGPAIEYSDGYKAWYQNGKLHRLDGPAIEWSDGSKAWYQNGKLHRLDGPAIEYSDGTKAWYQNGKRHRIDGPAREYADGYKVWWYENNYYENSYSGYTQEKFEEDLRRDGKITPSSHKKDFSTFQKTINTLSNRDDKHTWSFILIVYLSNGQVVQSTETGSGHISAFRSFYKWLYVNSDPYYTLFNSDGVHIISRKKIDYITIKEIK